MIFPEFGAQSEEEPVAEGDTAEVADEIEGVIEVKIVADQVWYGFRENGDG